MALKPYSGPVVNPTAADQLAAAGDAGPTLGESIGGLSRDFAGSAISTGGGGILEGAAQFARKAGRVTGLDTGGRAADVLAGAGRGAQQFGEQLQQNAAPAYRQKVAGTQISGELSSPSTWSLGEDPSLLGLGSQFAQGLGSTVPTLAVGAATRGKLAPTALTAAAMGGGAAAQQERDRVLAMSDEELAKLPGYQQRLAQMTPEQARVSLAEDTAASVFKETAPVSAADVLFEVLPFTGGFQRALGRAVGTGRLPRAALAGATGALGEGVQEVSESAATRMGAQEVTGEQGPIFQNTLADFALGALVGGPLSAGGAVLTSPEAAAAELGEDAAPAPAPVPVAVEETVIDPADGPLSRMVATEAANELGSPVVAPVSIRTPLADEQALQQQGDQQRDFERDQQRQTRREVERPREAANDDGVPFMVTLGMRRDLAALGYSGPEIAKMKPAEAWNIIRAATEGAPTPSTTAAQAATTKESTNGVPEEIDRRGGAGQPGADAAAPDAPAAPAAAAEAGQEGQEEAAGQEVQEHPAEAGRSVPGDRVLTEAATPGIDRTPEPMEGDITPPSSDRFDLRDAADRAAARTPGSEVIELSDGGFVVRAPKEITPNEAVDTGSDAVVAPEQGAGAVPADAGTEPGAAPDAQPETALDTGSAVPEGGAPAAPEVPAEDGGAREPAVESGDGGAIPDPALVEQGAGGVDGRGDTGFGAGVAAGDNGGNASGGEAAADRESGVASGEGDAGQTAAGGGEPAGSQRDGVDQPVGEPAQAPLTEDEWTAAAPSARRKAIDAVIAAGGMRAGLTPRVLWKNLRPDERAALGPILRGAAAPAGNDQGAGEQQPAGEQPEQAAGGEQQAPRRGEVGGKLSEGEVVTTSSGRQTTPFPKIDDSTNRKALNTERRVERWLMENALAEAEARGDTFNASQFRASLEKPSQADKDSAEEYLFGEQPAVVPPIIRPLSGEGGEQASGEAAPAGEGTPPAPPSAPDQEQAGRGTSEEQGEASDTSLGGGEPAADATDPGSRKGPTASDGADATTEQVTAPRTEKLEDAGEELVGHRSWRNKLREQRTTDRAKDAAKLLDTITRVDAFRVRAHDEATPGAIRLLEQFRNSLDTFTDVAVSEMGLWTRDNAPKQTLIDEIANDQARYDEAEEIAARYMTDLTGLAAQLDGVRTVDEVEARLLEALFMPPAEGDTHARYNELGKAIEPYLGRNADFPRAIARRIKHLAEGQRSGEDKATVKTKPLTRPKLEGLERENLPDRRNGKDVTAEDLRAAFGFRGVNYGEYVNAKERQLHTNHAYDALHDLADVLGVPPNAMSLGGTLGLSIGKEGSGKAAAHFEPGTKIINITKGRGDGSVAHEWAHALSDYLRNRHTTSRKAADIRAFLQNYYSLDKLKERVDSLLSGNSFIKNNRRAGAKGAAEELLRYEYWRTNDSWGVFKETAYKRAGNELGKSYWGSAEEMWARAFEAWVYDRIDGYSPYLVSSWVADGATTKEAGYRGTPYPTSEERAAFAAEFDAIKAALQVDDSGHIALDPDYKTAMTRQLQSLREWSKWALENLDELHSKAVGGHPSAKGLFWYGSKKGRETGSVPRGYNAYIETSGGYAYLGYPEALTAEQITAFGLSTQRVANDSAGIVMVRDMPNAGSTDPLVEHLYRNIRFGQMPADNIALRKMVAKFDGKPVEGARMKQAQEALETAIVRRARDLVAEGKSDRSTFDALLKLYESQPNLNVRTSTSVANQAYSTPAPLAFLADKLAGIDYTSKVYEPTAGNGMLLIAAAPANVTANELNSARAESLRQQGFDTREGDALTAVGDVVQPGTQDAVVSNPPFDNLRDADGKPEKREFDGYKLGKLDHLIVADALRAMKDDGKATLIIGANMPAGQITTDDRIFFNWLYSHYNVTGHFEVDGKLYSRQGASWPVRVITINGRMASENTSPQPGAIGRVNNWNDVYERFAEVLGAQERAIERQDDSGRGQGAERDGGAGRGGLPFADGGQGGRTGGGSRTGGSRDGAGSQPGEPTGASGNSGERAGEQLGGRADEQRSDDAAPEQDRLEQGDREQADAATSERDTRRAARNDARNADRNALTDAENAFQTAYTPQSSRKDEGVLVPINMAGPMQQALARLEDAVGNIDAYAAKELGYSSIDEMLGIDGEGNQSTNGLMGLQVDSVASAIYQNKVRGKGVIIADQTGIGKGRQAAAMIRWAEKQGMIPVFITVKPSLFTDMYGDLADIGSNNIKPFILNKDEWISGKDGKRLFANKVAGHSKNLKAIAESGKLPAGSNALFMTYSQINSDNVQRRALSAIAPNAFFILDESHNAGGDSNTGGFIRDTLNNVRGAVYLSATYAKRPDNIPVYFKTDIGDAIEGGSEALVSAMQQGGLPLQTVVSNGLVQAGQMFRRERSYDGVSIVTSVDTANRAKHERLSDRVTEALRAIVDADSEFHDGYVRALQEQAKRRGEEVGGAGNQAAESVNHAEFSSVVHNFIKQLLLGLKADTAADKAIEAIKAGKKPLIALENTMGSFLDSYASDNDLNDGDLLGSFDYRSVLTRALDRTRYVVRQDQRGNKEREYIPLSKLDPNTRRLYEQAQRTIDGLNDIADIPVSPVDWIRHRIQQAGYSVAEITGRDRAVDYSGEAPKLTRVPSEEQNDKVLTTNRFNSGKLDAIILNVSGSTGISLHASERFKDKRKRKMIVAQPASDINIFMQMLGRIHRTGQVELPEYELLNVDLPAEKRPTAVLNKKMKSLNANTSSNSESATSIKSADILNKYGDQIVNNYLYDNPTLADALNLHPNDPSGEAKVENDIARKATGRLALMPVPTQLAFYEEIEQQYNDLIDYLNKTGQNDLEPRTLDYDAELDEEHTILDATNPDSPFGGEAVYGEYRIKAQGKAMTIDEIKAEAKEHLGDLTPQAHAEQLIERLNKQVPKRPVPEGAAPAADEPATLEGRAFIRRHPIGSLWRVEINGDIYNAVITNLRNSHKKNGNPFSLSKTQVTLALNGPLRQITVPASQWGRIEVAPITGWGANIDTLFREQAEGSQTAKIVTGNLLGAYGELRGTASQIVSFTKKDGTVEQGILLPKKFDLAKNTYGDFQLRGADAVLTFLSRSTNPDVDRFGVASRDQTLRVQMNNDGSLLITVPKSKGRGGKYYLNQKLLAHTGDFVSSGDSMRATVPKAKAKAALEAAMANTALYAQPSMAEEARAILSGPRGAQSRPAPDRGTGWVDTGVLDRAVSRVTAQWRGDIPIVRVVTLAEELPAAAKAGKGWETAEGWYDGDRTVYLVANNVQNVNRGLQVLAHEALGHYGVEAVLGKAQWTQVVGDVAKLRRRADSLPADMKAAMASTVRRYGNESASTFAREFLAVMAERGVKSSLTARIFAAVRRWLRSMGFPVDAWAADELRTIVSEGAKQVTKRRKARQSGDIRGAAMSERASPFFSAMVEAVERGQGAPRRGTAAQWKGWLDGAQRRGEFRQAERDWLGVDAWLNQQEGPITREQVADLVRANQVRVEDVVLGEDAAAARNERQRAIMGELERNHGISAMYDGDGGFDWITLAEDFPVEEWSSEAAALRDEFLSLNDEEVAQGGQTKFGEYQLPGGENYRELLLTIPTPPATMVPNLHAQRRADGNWEVVRRDGDLIKAFRTEEEANRYVQNNAMMGVVQAPEYRSSHWDQPNILAHVRFNERTDADGKRVLFLEEVQSDWHQAGRKRGYATSRLERPDTTGWRAEEATIYGAPYWRVSTATGQQYFSMPREDASTPEAAIASAVEQRMAGEGNANPEPRVPNAPFKATDEWAMLAFKRMVRHAAENGFDRIAWTTGEQQAERYDLSKRVDEIEVTNLDDAKAGEVSKHIKIDLPGSSIGIGVDSDGVVRNTGNNNREMLGKALDDVVGKEIADRIMQRNEGRFVLSGDGLKVGGAGMRAFYDKILPAAVNKWAKKLGGRVGEFVQESGVTHKKLVDGKFVVVPDPGTWRAHGLDLTDAMREVALAGMPLFSRPETAYAVLDNRGKELGRAATPVEANRVASKLRAAGKRVAEIKAVQSVVDALDRRARAPHTPIPSRFDAEQRVAAEKIATFRPGEALSTRVDRIRDKFASRLVQKAFDQFRPLGELSPEAFMQAHLSKASDGALEGLFNHGRVRIREGAYDVMENTGGFKGVLSSLNGEHNDFLMWVVGNRAEALAEEGRERLFTEDDIRAMKRLNQGRMADGRNRAEVYGAALRELRAYNKSVLDIAQEAGLIDGEARKVWESEFYIPFYRTMEDDATNGPGQIKGLLRQQVIKRLNGGTEPLGDPLENILANWSHMLGASMRNMAAVKALQAAKEMGIAEGVTSTGRTEEGQKVKGSVWVMQGGVKSHWIVHEPSILEALESLSFNGYNNPIMRAAGKFKRALTMGVTINPSFRIRNLARDVAASLATADVNYNPVKNIVDGLKLTKHNTETWATLVTSGGAIRFGVVNDGDQAKHAKRMVELGIKDQQLLDTPEKMQNALRKAYDWWQEWGDRVETVNRAVIYDRAIKAGKTHLQAAFEARDLMNFTSMGSSTAVRALSQVLPFFNARLQGLDRLARGAKKDPRRFLSTVGVMALASAMLYLLNHDDDDYKKLPDYARDNNWVFRLPGTDHFLFIPKPFEVGALATVVERATELAVSGDDYKARDFATNLAGILSSQLQMDPIPQIVRPATEALFNYDMFRRAPIDNLGQMRLLPEDRYTARTSAGAIAAGRVVGMSPQRIERLVEGYLGWIGTQVLNVSDHLMRATGMMPRGPQQDATKTDNLFVLGSFVREAGSGSSKYITRFYDTQKQLDTIYASATAARKAGDVERALELLNDPKMKARPLFQHADKQMTAINRQIRAITNHPTMSASEKTEKLEALNRRRSEIAQRVDAAARALR